MITLQLPAVRVFDEETSRVRTLPAKSIRLEHSLNSLAAWEAETKKPFIKTFSEVSSITPEYLLLYIRCMDVDGLLTDEDMERLTQDNVEKVFEYINDPQTATTVHTKKEESSSEIITAEIIYWWMCHFHIPPQYEYWHLNRLLMLIKVCNVKEQGPNKESKAEAIARTRALNKARRAKAKAPH